MKLIKIKLMNFRGYKKEIEMDLNNLTALVGKNDIGKSTILEALEIFFNNSLVTCDNDDLNIYADENSFSITCCFTELPDEIIIDSTSTTSLFNEKLLNEDGHLEIKKTFKTGGTKPKEEIFIRCMHYSNEELKDLLSKKNTELKKIAQRLKINEETYNSTSNVSLRKAIREKIDDFDLTSISIDVTKEDAKKIFENIKQYLPLFALFQSDRESTDNDKEIIDPMKLAIREALREVTDELNDIKEKVQSKAMGIANRTLEKMSEMSNDISSSLTANFKSEPKFESAFKLSIRSDNNISMNKRGSGVRRLLLLNFFRAEAERRMEESRTSSVIYAFEEPETSQHPDFQQMLIKSFIELSGISNTQIILTTHTPHLAGLINTDDIRLIKKNYNGESVIASREDAILSEICDELGLLPETISIVNQAILLVEGPGDDVFIHHISDKLYEHNILPTSFKNENFAIIPVGGCGTLKYWVTKQKLIDQFNLPWCVLLDSDKGTNEALNNLKQVQELRDDGIKAYVTRKREPENYIHIDCLSQTVVYNEEDDAKKIIAKAIKMRDTRVLIEIWPTMSFEQIRETEQYFDENGDEHYEFTEMFEDFFSLTSKK